MKTQRKFNPLWIALTALILASLACSLFTDTSGVNVDQPATDVPSPTSEPAPVNNTDNSNNGLSAQERADLIAATVQIYGLFKDKSGDLYPAYVGSGTIISPDGLILTNAHVASPASQGDVENEPDALAVGLVEHEDKPAVFSYLAEVQAVDGFLDLAVIRITSDLKGNAINSSDLSLPFVPLGNSDEVHVGDHLSIFGFPAIGGETITFTTGNISGFSSEEAVGDRAWLKTDATISGGNSGGLGADDNGHIVGVPTIAASGAAGANATDCRVIQDTNGDGQMDNSDTCIPIGGFINALRPVNLALPLIQAAKTGKEYASPYGTFGGGSEPVNGSGNQQFSDLTWVTVDKDGTPIDEVASFPSGSDLIGASFAYSGMTDGETWGERWYANGEVKAEGEFAWEWGSDGTLTVYLYNEDGSELVDGTYSLELFLPDGTVLLTAEVQVGDSSGSQQPASSGKGILLSGRVVDGDTKKGLSGALVIVLNPGVTVDDWVANNYPDADIYAITQTDIKGKFALPVQLKRNVAYNIVIALDGYQAQVFENEKFTDSDPTEFEVTVELVK